MNKKILLTTMLFCMVEVNIVSASNSVSSGLSEKAKATDFLNNLLSMQQEAEKEINTLQDEVVGLEEKLESAGYGRSSWERILNGSVDVKWENISVSFSQIPLLPNGDTTMADVGRVIETRPDITSVSMDIWKVASVIKYIMKLEEKIDNFKKAKNNFGLIQTILAQKSQTDSDTVRFKCIASPKPNYKELLNNLDTIQRKNVYLLAQLGNVWQEAEKEAENASNPQGSVDSFIERVDFLYKKIKEDTGNTVLCFEQGKKEVIEIAASTPKKRKEIMTNIMGLQDKIKKNTGKYDKTKDAKLEESVNALKSKLRKEKRALVNCDKRFVSSYDFLRELKDPGRYPERKETGGLTEFLIRSEPIGVNDYYGSEAKEKLEDIKKSKSEIDNRMTEYDANSRCVSIWGGGCDNNQLSSYIGLRTDIKTKESDVSLILEDTKSIYNDIKSAGKCGVINTEYSREITFSDSEEEDDGDSMDSGNIPQTKEGIEEKIKKHIEGKIEEEGEKFDIDMYAFFVNEETSEYSDEWKYYLDNEIENMKDKDDELVKLLYAYRNFPPEPDHIDGVNEGNYEQKIGEASKKAVNSGKNKSKATGTTTTGKKNGLQKNASTAGSASASSAATKNIRGRGGNAKADTKVTEQKKTRTQPARGAKGFRNK